MSFKLGALLNPCCKTECFPYITPMWSVQGESKNFLLNCGCKNCLLGLSLVLQPGYFYPKCTVVISSCPRSTHRYSWQVMGTKIKSENVVRQAATALTVKNHLIMSIMYTFWVRSAHVCRQFSGSLACSIGQVFLLLAYILGYFIVSHQLGCNIRLNNFIIISTLFPSPEGLKWCLFPKGKKKTSTSLANEWSVWIRGQNQMLQLVAL